MDSAYSVALVEAPEMPLLDGDNTFYIADGLKLVFKEWHKLVRVNLLQESEADVEAKWHCEYHYDNSLNET